MLKLTNKKNKLFNAEKFDCLDQCKISGLSYFCDIVLSVQEVDQTRVKLKEDN